MTINKATSATQWQLSMFVECGITYLNALRAMGAKMPPEVAIMASLNKIRDSDSART